MRPYLTLHDPARARAYTEAGLWGRETFYALMAQARARAARCAGVARRDRGS